jgi:hypothetical protein
MDLCHIGLQQWSNTEEKNTGGSYPPVNLSPAPGKTPFKILMKFNFSVILVIENA